MLLESGDLAPRFQFPHVDLGMKPLPAKMHRRGDVSSIRAERDRQMATLEYPYFLVVCTMTVPERNRSIDAGAGEIAAIGTVLHVEHLLLGVRRRGAAP